MLILSAPGHEGSQLWQSPAAVAPALERAADAVPEEVVDVLAAGVVEEFLDICAHRAAAQRLLDSLHEQEEGEQQYRKEHHQESGHRGLVCPRPSRLLPAARRTLVAVAGAAARHRKIAAETPLSRTRRARRINAELARLHPDAHCELDFTTPLELLVATILSAQTTDKMVNSVTPTLFAKYCTAADYAGADVAEMEGLLKPTGFFRAKTKSLIGLGQALVERYGGAVPAKMADLVTLPGVGRKTANVVLGNAFGIPGITPDTHFQRVVRRWGWTQESDPVKIEHAVGALIPRKDWTILSHRVIFHGRRVCHARKPACGACALAAWCPSYGDGPVDPDLAAKLVRGPDEAARARAAALGLPIRTAAEIAELAREQSA